MIELTHSQIRMIRATIRQSLGIDSSQEDLCITFRAISDGLRIQAIAEQHAIEYLVPGEYQPECFAVQDIALAACEAQLSGIVSLTKQNDSVWLQWCDEGNPQSVQISAVAPANMPAAPDQLLTNDCRLLTAMRDAMATTEHTSLRCATNCVRLRGTDGQIAATDHRQALVQSGFTFPWKDDVLVSASGAFQTPEFSAATHVAIGRSAAWVTVQANAWRLHLKIEKGLRFPCVDRQIPSGSSVTTRLVISDTDAECLRESLSQLPGAADDHAPITVDLDGVVTVRGESMDQSRVAELVLRNSHSIGHQLRFHTNREFLVRALALGFRNLCLRSDIGPAVCQDDRRTYLWALLSEEHAFPSGSDNTRISSSVIA
jgi:hypothetical protein